MIKKMRREWDQMHGDPTQMDEKLKAQLAALDEMAQPNAPTTKPEQKPRTHDDMLAEFNMIHSVASQPLTESDVNVKAAVTSAKHAFSDD